MEAAFVNQGLLKAARVIALMAKALYITDFIVILLVWVPNLIKQFSFL